MSKTIAEFAEELQNIRERFVALNSTGLGFADNLHHADFFTAEWIKSSNVYYSWASFQPEPYTNKWLDEVENSINAYDDWAEEVNEIDRLYLPYSSGFSEKQVVDLVREAIQINRDFNELVKDNPLASMSVITFENVVRISSEYYETSACW